MTTLLAAASQAPSWLPILIGGGGIFGLATAATTLYMARSQRDNNVADAAKKLIEGSTMFADAVNEELDLTRRELRAVRTKLGEVTACMDEMRELLLRERDERGKVERKLEQTMAELAEARAAIGGRRHDDADRQQPHD